jgi:hypothetical protein
MYVWPKTAAAGDEKVGGHPVVSYQVSAAAVLIPNPCSNLSAHIWLTMCQAPLHQAAHVDSQNEVICRLRSDMMTWHLPSSTADSLLM